MRVQVSPWLPIHILEVKTMTVTVIFKDNSGKKHDSEKFDVSSYTVHTYNFLELRLTNGLILQLNMDNIFSFQICVK